ncbi:MAG: hypothetical protein M1823_000826 [Watsoniomyces obsoletus]|nr:MAG: hypothetical protein M1823_000826 [Watsoniomyces obsoletus]
MPDDRPHPLLAQVPLSVSPFISLPRPTTLPYTYKTLPSTLPRASVVGDPSGDPNNSGLVVSASGLVAHPDDIVQSCRRLQEHLRKRKEDAEKLIAEWERNINERELAEKRSKAPGWLDREERLLEPERAGGQKNLVDVGAVEGRLGENQVNAQSENQEGEELDRAFGGLYVE